MLNFLLTKKGTCANMLSADCLSIIADSIKEKIKTDLTENQIFYHLSMINAILCENRYGVEISNSLSKINKYQKVSYNELQIAAFVASFKNMIDSYLDDESEEMKNYLKTLNLFNKLYKYFYRNKFYSNKEIYYFDNIIYFYDPTSSEVTNEQSKNLIANILDKKQK